MKATEFVEQARTALHAQGLAAFAQELVETGVLEADDNPQPEPRSIEVEGIEVEGPDEEGDLFFETPAHNGYVEEAKAAPLARALLAWVAAGEPQEEPQAAPGPLLREEGGSFASVTVEGDDGCNPVHLSFRRHTEDSDWLVFGDALDDMPSYVTDETYRRIPVAALAELAAHFCPPRPEPAQGTKERPYIWKRRTEGGGTEEVPVWLEKTGDTLFLYAGDPGTGKAIAACFQEDGPAYLTNYRGEKLFAVKGDLPQPAAQPEPETGEVVLRLTGEEARAVAILCSNVHPSGSTLADAAVEVTEKLADYLPDVEDPANDLGITFQD